MQVTKIIRSTSTLPDLRRSCRKQDYEELLGQALWRFVSLHSKCSTKNKAGKNFLSKRLTRTDSAPEQTDHALCSLSLTVVHPTHGHTPL